MISTTTTGSHEISMSLETTVERQEGGILDDVFLVDI